MKTWKALLLLVLAPVASAQDYRQQYAEQWPLSLSSEQSGAYRVVLEPQIYQRAWSPRLADVQVYNAAGQALPSALLQPEQPLAQPPVQRELPWFVLPSLAAERRDDLQLLAERDGQGRVLRLQARTGAGAGPQGGWLIDASVLGQQPVSSLVLDWVERSEPLQMTVRVDASDDLRHWVPVDSEVALVDLQRAGKRLLQRRLQIDRGVRYLRVLAQDSQPLPALRGVLAELPAAPATLTWEWVTAQPAASSTPGSFQFTLDGRYPVRQLDVDTAGNSLVRWSAWSRDDSSAEWQLRAAPWLAYQVQQDGQAAQRSPPRELAQATRDRYWKLVAEPEAGVAAPVLRLGYRAEVLVFLSQGAAPYALAVGSATAQRVDAPVALLIDELRMRNGPAWQPTLARLESMPEPLAGDAATHRAGDWKQWLLWAVLVLGVLGVISLAVSVLRQKPAQPPSSPG